MKYYKQTLTAFTFLLTLSSCYNVRMTNSNNKRFWVYSLRNDAYKVNKHLEKTRIGNFNPKNIDVQSDTFMHSRQYEYLSTEDLKEIVSQNESTVVFFWLTDCSFSTYYVMSAARRLKEQHRNVFLLSTEYELDKMDRNLYGGKYFFSSYIINHTPYGSHILTKIIGYIKELDKDYYAKMKDDVIDFAAIVVNKDGMIVKGITLEQLKEMLESKTIGDIGDQ